MSDQQRTPILTITPRNPATLLRILDFITELQRQGIEVDYHGSSLINKVDSPPEILVSTNQVRFIDDLDETTQYLARIHVIDTGGNVYVDIGLEQRRIINGTIRRWNLFIQNRAVFENAKIQRGQLFWITLGNVNLDREFVGAFFRSLFEP
jgi:hypothetical protein